MSCCWRDRVNDAGRATAAIITPAATAGACCLKPQKWCAIQDPIQRMQAAAQALRCRWLLRWTLFAVLARTQAHAVPLVELPPLDEGGGEGFVDGRKLLRGVLRYVEDPDAEVARSMSLKLLPALACAWAAAAYVAYRAFRSNSWLSVAGVAGIAWLVLKA